MNNFRVTISSEARKSIRYIKKETYLIDGNRAVVDQAVAMRAVEMTDIGWKPVKTEPPKLPGKYIVYGDTTGEGEQVDIATYYDNAWEKANDPDFWRPLPENPKEKKQC